MNGIDRRRHTRQLRLPEIGEAGQRRLAEATIALGGRGAAREIEATYLERAGVRIASDGETLAVDVDGLGLKSSAARDVGEGALRALAAVRSVLGVGEG